MEGIYRPGEFVWHELFTSDLDRSTGFYGELLGWRTDEVTTPDGSRYLVFRMGDLEVGGCMQVPPYRPSCWSVYVSVDDVDATANRARRKRGRVIAGPRDVSDVGRFVTLADPMGAVVNAWRSTTGDGPGVGAAGPVPGAFCWEELHTPDPEAASSFYGALFGWTEQADGLEPGVPVWMAGTARAASWLRIPAADDTAWLSYVAVESLEETLSRAARVGGRVVRVRCAGEALGTVGVIEDNVGARMGLFEAVRV